MHQVHLFTMKIGHQNYIINKAKTLHSATNYNEGFMNEIQLSIESFCKNIENVYKRFST